MSADITTSTAKSTPTQYSVNVWQWLTKVPQVEKKAYSADQVRLLAIIAPMLAALVIIAALALWITSDGTLASLSGVVVLMIAAAELLGSWALNRQGSYTTAAMGVIATMIAAPLLLLLVSERNSALLVFSAIVAATSVPLCSVFLPERNWTSRATAIVLIAFCLLPVVAPRYAFSEVIFPLLALSLVTLINVMHEYRYRAFAGTQQAQQAQFEAEKNALQTAQQASEAVLRQTIAKLEQQIKDSAIELEATVDEFVRVNEEVEQAKEAAEKARAETERANTVKSAFLASMSHELRTPLNAVINFTKFVAKGSMGPVNEEQVETLNEVIDSARHLLNLINDVLDMSKIESGSLNLFIENNVSLKAILETVVSTGKSLIVEKEIELKTEIADMLPLIKGDRQRILQILLNIVSNAIKFTDEGYVSIKAYRQDQEVVFAIEDTGAGIAAEDQAAVFEAFKQTTTGLRQGGGTGLGMPITKNLVEAHGGRPSP
ncbi:MAG: hypothetical protein KF726_02675 [Anaerolineae bacterium]|nr:hypothetical protein [Anaerolineae bacterium]